MKARQQEKIAVSASKFEKLPDEIILCIMKYLGYREWSTLAVASKIILKIAKDNSLWVRYFFPINLHPSVISP